MFASMTHDDHPAPKQRLQVVIERDYAEKLRELAEEDDRTLSSYIRQVLVGHLDRGDY